MQGRAGHAAVLASVCLLLFAVAGIQGDKGDETQRLKDELAEMKAQQQALQAQLAAMMEMMKQQQTQGTPTEVAQANSGQEQVAEEMDIEAEAAKSEAEIAAAGLQDPYTLSTEQILHFTTRGYVRLDGLLPQVEQYTQAFVDAKKAAELNWVRFAMESTPCDDAMIDQLPEHTINDSHSTQELDEMITQAYGLYSRCLEMIQGGHVPYYQVIHLHRENAVVEAFAKSKRLAKLAADLLQVNAVRLYQTTAFFIAPPSKMAAGNQVLSNTQQNRLSEAVHSKHRDEIGVSQHTSEHEDLNMAPVDMPDYVTIWCPLHALDKERSTLWFQARSHNDFAGLYWNDESHARNSFLNRTGQYNGKWSEAERVLGEQMYTFTGFSAGDCTAHHGWVRHAAPRNSDPKGRVRRAVSFHYISAEARKLWSTRVRGGEEHQEEDKLSYQGWYHDIKDNGLLDHPLLPLVYVRQHDDTAMDIRDPHASVVPLSEWADTDKLRQEFEANSATRQ